MAERGEVNAFQSFFASDSILWEGAWGSSSIRFRHNQDAGCPSAFPSYGKSQFQPLPTPVSPPDSHVKRTPFQGRKFHLTALATAGAAAFLILFVLLLTTSRSPNQAHAQSSANVDISLSDTSVDQGTAITATMSFSGLEDDADTSTTDYIFRADVLDSDNGDADGCEGGGMGVDRNINQVDENPETRAGTIAAACPPGDYTLGVGISSAANEELASASVAFTIAAPASSPEGTCSESPNPVGVEVEAVPIVVESTTDEYFVLYVRHELDADTTLWMPVSVTLGGAGTTTVAENVEALPKERYRVDKYSVACPADVDGDGIDDITELADPVGMNPVNPAAAIDFGDGAVAVPDWETFDTLSSSGFSLKFVMLGTDTDRPRVYFQNTKTHSIHLDFLDAVGIEPGTDGLLRGEVAYGPELVAPDGSQGVYYYRLKTYYRGFFSLAALSHTLIAASMPVLEDNLAYYIPKFALPYYQSDLPLYRESRINLLFDEDIFPETRFLALNPGEGYGRLRVMEADERPNPRDVVIYEALPNELPRVAGIISTVPQTPLSHVNLRAVQDGIPNAFIRSALDEPAIESLLGGYVRYEVTERGWTLRAATRAEVDAHYASSRPAAKQTPQRDLSVTEITALSEVGFDDWDAFGVKAANVAVLGTLDFPAGTVPDGFAVPFYFYDEFMKANDLYDDIATMLADTDFQTDFDTQEKELKKLRKKIKKGETPDWIITALEEMHGEFPEGTSLRYRSSTNNEDLPGFNGAGLYDSKTQHPEETEEDGIAKSLKQVYASLWNFRAFTEREFYRVDHLAAAMGVLVHPNYSDELVNGVAVSFDPITGRDGYYYVNSQIGEDLVTNPEAHSVPEEILLYRVDRYLRYDVLGTSNQAEPGQLLMSRDQLGQLRRHLAVIHEEFAELYGVGPGEQFAMEIEFKITSENILAIKQARPWVFEGAPTAAPPGDAMLSGLTLSGVPFTFASDTASYVVNVANDMDETTVTATANDGGATYVVKLGGVTDEDSVVPLAVGSNVITIEVTAEDGKTAKTYTVTVTRAEPASGPAVAIGLSPSGPVEEGTEITVTMSFGGLGRDSDPNDVDYIFRADVVSRADGNSADVCEGKGIGSNRNFNQVDEDPEVRTGTVSASCTPGDYTVEVSVSSPGNIELASSTADFTVNAPGQQPPEPPSTDATLNGLALSGVYFGTFYAATTGYTASVANDVDETTVIPATNDAGATYKVKLDGVADADGTVELSVGSNVITIEVTAEDGNTAKTYTVTVTRAEPLSTDATLSGLELSGIDFGAFDPATTGYTASVANGVDETTVTPTTNDGGAIYAIKLGGVAHADGTVELSVGSNVITVEVTAEDGNTTKTYTVTVTRAEQPVSGPAVAVALSPSGPVEEGTEVTVTMSFGGLERDSDPGDVDYIFRADVKNSASGNADDCEDQERGYGLGVDRYMKQVDENPEVRTGNISASCAPGDYTVKVSVSSPSNIELATATADFTVNAPGQQQPEPPSSDATLNSLALSGVYFGAFDSATTGYTANVANGVDETTVTPTVNDDGATYAIKLGGVTDADGVIPLAVGSNVITVEVTAEDGNTAKTYTVTTTRAEPPSTDATLSNLTLSGINIGPFDSATTEYNASVANDVDETTVTPTANDGGASYVVKLGDEVDEDGTVELSAGANAVTVVVTAEDGKTTKTYTVTVNRDAPPEPVEPEPESTGERSAWLESNPENKPFVGEWQHFTLRGSGLDKVDLQVNVIGFDGAPGSTGAVGYATASPPPAVGEVCGDAYYSGYQMSVDATFSLVGCREGTVVIELLDPGNDWALLKRYTVTVNAGP